MANDITGLDAVQAKLRQLGNKRKAKNAATRSARKAMNIVKKAAVQTAKGFDDKDSGNKIWKNIVTKAGKTKGTGSLVMKVGVKGGAKQAKDTGNSGGDTFYWRYREYGTATQSASPFLRPALNNSIDAVKAEFTRAYSEELDKEIAKL
nr:HK97-gp10 family putative phage morphogenesis protein [uncultured Psychrobacter sp.]